MENGDWEQQVLYGTNALPIPQLAAIRHGHISVRQLRPHLSDDIWNSYFKFTFVRNPYDRFVSTYFFLHRGQSLTDRNETRNMKAAIRYEPYRRMIHVAPQHQLITSNGGKIAVDYVAKFENLQSEYDEICKRIGIPSKTLIRKNQSEHNSFSSYYDVELRSLVSNFYRADFELFGYDVVR